MAKDNADLGNWSLAANRLYYSVFYMTLAVNLNNGDSSKSHNGTFNIFSRRYVATGIMTGSVSQSVSEASSLKPVDLR